MKVGKCPICGGDTKEDIVEVQEIIEGEAYIISGVCECRGLCSVW